MNPEKLAERLQHARRLALRWHILTCLYVTRPYGSTEQSLVDFIQPSYADFTFAECQRELDYLSGTGMVEILQKDTFAQSARITAKGVDVVEYTAPCPDGISRPRRV